MKLEQLIDTIHIKLQINNDLRNIIPLFVKYTNNDWEDHIYFYTERPYIKPLYKDKMFEIYIICWNNNQETKIINYPNRNCLTKILYGVINEYLYLENNLDKYKSIIRNKDDISFLKNGLYHKYSTKNMKCIGLQLYSKIY